MDRSSKQPLDKSAYTLNRVQQNWYIVCRSDQLNDTPISVRLWDEPFVLFRDERGKVQALIDRCPHRNVPLSAGKCKSGKLECGYHGWIFDGEGVCTEIPSLHPEDSLPKIRADAFPTVESQGYVWLFPSLEEPKLAPFSFPHLSDGNYVSIRYQTDFEASIYCTAENILDVPHTNVLHKGLFRQDQRKEVEVEIRRYSDRVVCEFLNEAPPSGLIGKILTRGASRVLHHDRFILPSVAEVEYAIPSGPKLVTTSFLTPVSDFLTRMYSVVSLTKSRWTNLAGPAVRPMVMKIVEQDARMLRKLTKNTVHFGREQFIHSRVDFLGPSIQALMKKASHEQIQPPQDTAPEEPSSTRRTKFLA
ncbi:MAG: aromatic ring-hydroxylating dioxygenase subunit alpha [Myxococcota bacterium]|nr:aromatic ring-hydroxylating dioxygenase subunit alpha [Myxococcota bacterium]